MKIFIVFLLLFTDFSFAVTVDDIHPMYPFYYREITCGKVTRVILTDKNRPGVIVIDAHSGNEYIDYDFNAAYLRAIQNNTFLQIERGCE